MQPQPFADVLSLPVSIVSSYNWDYTVHKAYNIFIQVFAKRKFADSAGDQPRLNQGIRRRDGVGEDQETTA